MRRSLNVILSVYSKIGFGTYEVGAGLANPRLCHWNPPKGQTKTIGACGKIIIFYYMELILWTGLKLMLYNFTCLTLNV